MRLLARNAESLFWLARYLERAACLARVIEMQSTFGGQDKDQGWNWLLTLHSNEAVFREQFEPSAETIVAFYLTDKGNVGSIRSSIHWARENARALRPFIPLEMWAQLNTFHHTIEQIGTDDIQRSKLPRTCAQIRAGCLAQIGVAEGLLYRDEGYQFFKLGLMIERADQTSRLLDVKFAQGSMPQSSALNTDPAHDFMFWSTILRTVGAYQVFHRLMTASPDAESVARFLVLNPSHPRSIGFCVREITDALNMLRSGFRLPGANAGLEACEILTQGLQVAAEDAQLLGRLHEFNDWVQRALIHVTAEIGGAFFRAPPPEYKLDAPPSAKTLISQSQTSTQGQSQSQGQT
jgi:uncharacterized alpha-E superfamily protein